MDSQLILSKHSFCLTEAFLDKLDKDPTQIVYTSEVAFFLGEIKTRNFYQIKIRDISYWANSITGTLYRNDLSCVTSNRLNLVRVPEEIKFLKAA